MRKRISLLAACGLVAVGLATTPANAADPVFTLSAPSGIGLRPHPAQGGEAQKTTVDFRIENPTSNSFDGPITFTVDLTKLKGIADVSLSENHGVADCKLTDTAVTCTQYGLWPHDYTVAALDVSAAKDAKLGTVVDLTMTGSAKGATFRPATTKVKVGGPDLVLADAGLKEEMKPGGTQPLPIVVSNTGTESAQGLSLVIHDTHGLDLVERYDNCSYGGDPGQDPDSTTVCTVDDEIKAGLIYETDPLTLKAAPYAFNEIVTYAVYEKGGEPKFPGASSKQQTGKKLTLKEQPAKAARLSADLNPQDNYREFDLHVTNTADFAATPVSLKGKAGETVKADLGFQNNGPAWVAYLRSGESVAITDIVIPAGAKVTKAAKECSSLNADGTHREERTGAPRYSCASDYVVGEKGKVSFPFELKIEKLVEDAKGSVSVGQWHGDADPKPQSWDPNHANNRAAFVINAKGSTTTPTPGPSTGTAAPSPAPSTSASAAPGAGNNAKPNGGLASTGSTAGPIAIGGAVLVAAGGALFVAFRRRAAARA
ncbi:hypothetical protein [Streptomyces sp. NBC_00503]|uniref:hypothetical protein n=1 Tax=Streptomyces sp. NBC_00503 TaxID=2903659 RepID=UPI002E81CF7B|nr:hypothetical protein [Streptomyces sp. NBC_00503]WUD83149.1 hypothetical protein OG490_22765 [Streptomyces sp. NBC_00503]